MQNLEQYLSGEKLWGDDFDLDEIAAWYADEKEGYAELGAKERANYCYSYHALNSLHGYRYLPKKQFNNVLGFGSAYGDEFLPILSHVHSLTITDPSEAFTNKDVHGVPVQYVKPLVSGELPFDNSLFDLICCFGVLHHIPNVGYVLTEIARVLRPGGYFLLREPIVSMGDWSVPRAGLTKRERGIPANILLEMVRKAGLQIVHFSPCQFSLTARFFKLFGMAAYNNRFVTFMDMWLSRMFSWNKSYHPANSFKKLRPTSLFLVLKKDKSRAHAKF